jgi:hypothetical protein
VNVAALLTSEDFAPLIEARPAAALARRVVGDYGGHVGRVLPGEWLPRRPGSANGTRDANTAYDSRTFLRRAGIGEAKIDELLSR